LLIFGKKLYCEDCKYGGKPPARGDACVHGLGGVGLPLVQQVSGSTAQLASSYKENIGQIVR
jgi:hypothetical protein